MKYMLQILNAPAYPDVIISCIGIANWSDETIIDSRIRSYTKVGWDNSSYVLSFLDEVDLEGANTIIVLNNYQPKIPQLLFDEFNQSIPVISLVKSNETTYSGLGISDDEIEIIIKSLKSDNNGYLLLRLVSTLTHEYRTRKEADEIKNLINRSKEVVGKKKLYTLKPDLVKVVEDKFGFKLPDDIKYFYQNFSEITNDFVSTMVGIEKETPPTFIVQISPEFAKQMVTNYLLLDEASKEALSNDINAIDEQNRKSASSDIEYLLIEGVNLFNYNVNSFDLSLIEDSYKDLSCDDKHIKLVLLTWAHCGGWGGLIVKGKNASFDGGGMYGHYLEVEVDGVQYEYSSNYYENMERHHINDYKDRIKQELTYKDNC